MTPSTESPTITQLRFNLMVARASVDAALAALDGVGAVAAFPPPRETLWQAVRRAIEAQDGPFGVREVAAILHRERQDVNEQRVGQYLSRMRKSGLLESRKRAGELPGRGAIYVVAKGNGRE